MTGEWRVEAILAVDVIDTRRTTESSIGRVHTNAVGLDLRPLDVYVLCIQGCQATELHRIRLVE